MGCLRALVASLAHVTSIDLFLRSVLLPTFFPGAAFRHGVAEPLVSPTPLFGAASSAADLPVMAVHGWVGCHAIWVLLTPVPATVLSALGALDGGLRCFALAPQAYPAEPTSSAERPQAKPCPSSMGLRAAAAFRRFGESLKDPFGHIVP